MIKIKNPIVRNILSAIAVAGFGFILLNLTFILDFLFQGLIIGLIKFFIPQVNPPMDYYWFPPTMHISFVIIIGLISWFFFKSKLKVLYKAIYMTVPLAVVLATLGMFFYPLPIVAYSLGGLFIISVLYYFYRTKQPWIYYYTLILVSLVMLMVSLLGVEI